MKRIRIGMVFFVIFWSDSDKDKYILKHHFVFSPSVTISTSFKAYVYDSIQSILCCVYVRGQFLIVCTTFVFVIHRVSVFLFCFAELLPCFFRMCPCIKLYISIFISLNGWIARVIVSGNQTTLLSPPSKTGLLLAGPGKKQGRCTSP